VSSHGTRQEGCPVSLFLLLSFAIFLPDGSGLKLARYIFSDYFSSSQDEFLQTAFLLLSRSPRCQNIRHSLLWIDKSIVTVLSTLMTYLYCLNNKSFETINGNITKKTTNMLSCKDLTYLGPSISNLRRFDPASGDLGHGLAVI